MSSYVCSSCGAVFKRWSGKCTSCGAFSTLEEVAPTAAPSNAGLKSSGAQKPAEAASTLKEISVNPLERVATGIGELDRVLGGGFVAGEVVLFAGQPGAGKSTLSLAMADAFASRGYSVLYSSGEESKQQIALRAARMGVTNDKIKIANETSLETLLGHIEDTNPGFVVVDSLQTLASEAIPGTVGSISQVKEAASSLTRLAKSRGIIMVFINQLIKSGDLSGPEAVLHMVDCGLMLESDQDSPLKILRALKNRFGDIGEIGCFVHDDTGLQEVADPGGIFLELGEEEAIQGAACGVMAEGIRQIPVEIQALTVASTLANPRRQFNGINFNRGQIVCAIVDKYSGAKTVDNDVYISTVSGAKVTDPLVDLAIAAAVLSSLTKKKVSRKTLFIGELSLTGTVRGSSMIDARIREAERLGFERVVYPGSFKPGKGHGIKLSPIKTLKELSAFLQ